MRAMFRSSSGDTFAHPWRSGALALFAGALAAACATFPGAPDEGGSPWRSVQTPHFALATDMDKTPAEDLARRLEGAWTAMEYALEAIPGGALEKGPGNEPVLVIALRNDRERQAAHQQWAGLFSANTLLPPALSIGDVNGDGGAELLQHELAHALLSKRLPRVPRWLNEGIAVYLQTAELDRRRQVVEWGIWSRHVMQQMRDYGINRVSVEALFDHARWKSEPGYYAMEIEAGLLVHMLVNRYPDELSCYLKRLATDLDPDAAMGCFPSRKRWASEMTDYDYERPQASKRASIVFPDVELLTAPMGDARVHTTLAMLDYMVLPSVERQFQPERRARAQGHVARALQLDPDQLLAILLRLTHPDADLTDARRTELTKRLVGEHPDAWASWIARAEAPDISGDEQAAAIDRAWALAPWRTEVLGWAAFRAFAASQWSEARTRAIKAWLAGLDRDENRALVFAASLQLGSCAEAESWLPPPNERKAFMSRVARLRAEVDAPPAACPGFSAAPKRVSDRTPDQALHSRQGNQADGIRGRRHVPRDFSQHLVGPLRRGRLPYQRHLSKPGRAEKGSADTPMERRNLGNAGGRFRDIFRNRLRRALGGIGTTDPRVAPESTGFSRAFALELLAFLVSACPGQRCAQPARDAEKALAAHLRDPAPRRENPVQRSLGNSKLEWS